MPSPYGLEIIDNCASCAWKKDGFFCQLSSPALKSFEEVKFTSSYPANAVLFVEGQVPRGVYLLCKGRVKLTMTSSEGKSIILRRCRTGRTDRPAGRHLRQALRGLPLRNARAMPGELHQAQKHSNWLIRDHRDIGAHVTGQFSNDYQSACVQIRSLGLSRTAEEKVARFLLECATNGRETNHGIRVNVALTHEEIAQVVGVSRETVTRTLSDFRQKSLITTNGPSVLIRNKPALEALVAA